MSSEPTSTSSDDRPAASMQRMEEFVRLFTKHEVQIFGLICSMLPHWADAEEVYQECSAVLWRKFDQFTPGTDFSKWASQVARYTVLNYRRKLRRERLYFSNEFLELIADEHAAASEDLAERRVALVQCLKKLPPRERELIRARYAGNKSVQTLATEAGCTAKSYYRLLDRIRQRLLDCASRLVSGPK